MVCVLTWHGLMWGGLSGDMTRMEVGWSVCCPGGMEVGWMCADLAWVELGVLCTDLASVEVVWFVCSYGMNGGGVVCV